MYSGGRTLADLGENWKTRDFQFSPKSAKVLPPLYIGGVPVKTAKFFCAREKCMLSDADGFKGASEPSAPDDFHFSRARKQTALS